jgi:hypothetical protein
MSMPHGIDQASIMAHGTAAFRIRDVAVNKGEERFMKNYPGCLVLGFMLFLGVQPVFAQANPECQDLKKEIESLKQGQAGLRQDLQEIKKLIKATHQAPAAPGGEFKEAIINIKGAPIAGNRNAKLALIEFTDYQ